MSDSWNFPLSKIRYVNENGLCRLLEKDLLQNPLGHAFDPIEIQ